MNCSPEQHISVTFSQPMEITTLLYNHWICTFRYTIVCWQCRPNQIKCLFSHVSHSVKTYPWFYQHHSRLYHSHSQCSPNVAEPPERLYFSWCKGVHALGLGTFISITVVFITNDLYHKITTEAFKPGTVAVIHWFNFQYLWHQPYNSRCAITYYYTDILM